jgi:hypothetical protein
MSSFIVKNKEGMLLRELGPFDVLLGRGTGPNENEGNRHFRDEVRKGEDEYCRQSQSRVAKDLVVLQTIEAVRERGGRFVRRVRQCKKRKKTNNAAPIRRNQQEESCDLYEVELRRDIVIEKVRQAFQYCRRRPTTDKKSTKKNKLSIKSSTDASLLGAKKTSTSSGGQRNPTTKTTTTTSSSRRTAAAAAAGTKPPTTTACSLEDETTRRAALPLFEQITGTCSKKSYSDQRDKDEREVQKAILIASIMGMQNFQEQQGALAVGGDAPTISILQHSPVQDPAASGRSNTTSHGPASSLFINDLGRTSSYSSYPSPSMNNGAAAALTGSSTTTPVLNLLQLLSMVPAGRSLVAPSNAFFAYPPFGSNTTCFSPHQQQALAAAAAPSGMRGEVDLQQQLSNVLEDHQNLLIEKIRKVLFENPRPPPPPPAPPSIFDSLFQ